MLGGAGQIQRNAVQTGLGSAQVVSNELVTVDLNTANNLSPVRKILARILRRGGFRFSLRAVLALEFVQGIQHCRHAGAAHIDLVLKLNKGTVQAHQLVNGLLHVLVLPVQAAVDRFQQDVNPAIIRGIIRYILKHEVVCTVADIDNCRHGTTDNGCDLCI